jgi:hypothetical protein
LPASLSFSNNFEIGSTKAPAQSGASYCPNP